jgi:hypothetical protein
MDTREEALAELVRVFDMIAETYRERGIPLPADTTEPLMPSAKGGTSRELQYSSASFSNALREVTNIGSTPTVVY